MKTHVTIPRGRAAPWNRRENRSRNHAGIAALHQRTGTDPGSGDRQQDTDGNEGERPQSNDRKDETRKDVVHSEIPPF